MRSNVYFTDFISRTNEENKINKVRKLFDAANFENLMDVDDIGSSKTPFW